jgi:5-methyltetrahydropteroyltriglutamate--homocysteine methyltransferase
MKRSSDRILVTHSGSLPRPEDLLEMYAEQDAPSELADRLPQAVEQVVRQQVELGIDIVNDGEYGKPTGARRPLYGHMTWLWYVHNRLAGFEWVQSEVKKVASKDRERFDRFYESSPIARDAAVWTCTGPISYIGQEAVQADIDNMKAAVAGLPVEDVFVAVASPTSVQSLLVNRHYATNEEYGWAVAEAMREEYRAIADAGFIVQVDDPVLAADWDGATPETTMEEYRKAAASRIEMLNYALEGVPEEQVRYHLCWGAWHGPHSSDIELSDIVDLILRINAGAYSLEAANPRHEHEWRIWEDVALPDGKILMPGLVTHKTVILEHPELVAERIVQFAEIVGRENVIASTDCGLGGRLNEQIAWAKLGVLQEGARLASERLWSPAPALSRRR